MTAPSDRSGSSSAGSSTENEVGATTNGSSPSSRDGSSSAAPTTQEPHDEHAPDVGDGDDRGRGAGQDDPRHADDRHVDDRDDDDRDDDDHDDPDESDGKPAKKQRPLAHELPILLVVAIGLALLLKAFVVQAFYIPSGSMEQTLLIKDRVLVNKVVYQFRDVHRGEIVVFNGSGTGFTQSESIIPPPTNTVQRVARTVQRVVGLGAPGERDFVKRVIAVGGDTVACCDAQGRVTVNGVPLDEPYVFENNPLDAGRTFAPERVPDGQLWVMGDHRGDSGDSRINGPIPQDRVIGRAFVRVWPISRFGFLPVPETFAEDRVAAAGASGGAMAGVVGFAVVPVLAGLRTRRRRP